MYKRKKILKIFLITLITIISIIIISLLGIIVYDRVTVNDEYSVSEQSISIPIFVYHNIVTDESQIEYDYMQTTKKEFEEQIKGLIDYGYNFITYDELIKFKNNEIKLKKNSCILTFDDGFNGVYENAYPIAKKYNIPFTMFIIINTVEKSGYITWDNLKEMKESGLVTIASHSMDHNDFSKLTVQEAVKNVKESYSIIEEKLGKQKNKIFTYPYGLYTEEEIIKLEEEGYIQNLTDNKINKSNNLDLSRLHRCYPLRDSPFKVLLKIWYRAFRY